MEMFITISRLWHLPQSNHVLEIRGDKWNSLETDHSQWFMGYVVSSLSFFRFSNIIFVLNQILLLMIHLVVSRPGSRFKTIFKRTIETLFTSGTRDVLEVGGHHYAPCPSWDCFIFTDDLDQVKVLVLSIMVSSVNACEWAGNHTRDSNGSVRISLDWDH